MVLKNFKIFLPSFGEHIFGSIAAFFTEWRVSVRIDFLGDFNIYLSVAWVISPQNRKI